MNKMVLLVGLLLISFGMGSFAYAIAEHEDMVRLNAILPDGTAVPLHSLVEPTDVRAIRVTGWTEVRGGPADFDVYYRLASENTLATDWKKALELRNLKDQRVDWNFSISREEIADFLNDLGVSNAPMDVHVTVIPKGADPNDFEYVDAGGWRAVDIAKYTNQLVEQEAEKEAAATNTETHTTRYPPSARKTTTSSVKSAAQKTKDYVEKYGYLYCGGHQDCLDVLREKFEEAAEKAENGLEPVVYMENGKDVFIPNCDKIEINLKSFTKIMCVVNNGKRTVKIVTKRVKLPKGNCYLAGKMDKGGEKCYTWRCGFKDYTYCGDKYHVLPEEVASDKPLGYHKSFSGGYVGGYVKREITIRRSPSGAYTTVSTSYYSNKSTAPTIAEPPSGYTPKWYKYMTRYKLHSLAFGVPVDADFLPLIIGFLSFVAGAWIIGRELS